MKIPPKLIPVFLGAARYRGAYGGRGSAKTRTFAKMAAIKGYEFAAENKPGIILCAREFQNSIDDSSMAEVKAAILSEPWLAVHYDIGERYIRTKDRRISFSFVGLRHNLDSIKSKARTRLCWIDEAEPVSEVAWAKLIPTVREEGSELWITWNPEREESATHKRFRLDPPDGAKIVELNWRDNKWFPSVLDDERLADKEKRPGSYDHIWEGGFVQAVEGAYFASDLTLAREQGRIAIVAPDPLMTTRAYWDIGGTGAKADATAIWIVQFVGTELRFLDYYEAQGQPLATHVQWLRSNGYDHAQCILPHDGAAGEKVYSVSYEGALRETGFDVRVVPNQGAGAAMLRVEAARRRFPSIRFNEAKTAAGLKSLGWYHEKRDPKRNLGLGPSHDWSSHGADAFGLACVDYETPKTPRQAAPQRQYGATGWMGV